VVNLNPSCSHNRPIPISLTTPDELDKILVASAPPAPSDASSPKSPDPDSESDDESDAEENVSPATDEVYDKCREKGCLLEWSMHHTDSDVGPYYVPRRMTAQSPFNTWQQLNMWDWNEFPHASWTKGYQDLDSEQWGIHVALEGLGVSRYTEFNKERGPNYIYSIVHEDILADDDLDDQKYQVDGKWYRATGADYVMSINTQDGVMIGMNRKGPADTAKDREPPLKPEEMPNLSQFSDVGWITWKKAAQQHENDIKKLRYFISISIENPQTRSVCRRIIHDNNLVLGRWPGHFFEGGTNEFNAILGKSHLVQKNPSSPQRY
jgi:hypothetical protein